MIKDKEKILVLEKELTLLKQKLLKQVSITTRRTKVLNYFDRILQDTSDIILTLDLDGFILKFNKGAELSLGYLQNEIVGKPFSGLFKSNKLKKDYSNISILTEKDIQNKQATLICQNKKEIIVSMSLASMRGENNNLLGIVVTCKDITRLKVMEKELKKKNSLLEELAITDNLSRLYNVRHFHNELKRHLARYNRKPNYSLTIMYVDIDHFKEVNDTKGHLEGDRIIEELGKIINNSFREHIDAGFRYGGDEFVILLPDTKPEQSIIVAERIINSFNEYDFLIPSLSIGITKLLNTDTEDSFVRRADKAMYEAKASGGNAYKIINETN